MTNEAAERLLGELGELLADEPSYDWDAAIAKVNEHDAAERRATVERIRGQVHLLARDTTMVGHTDVCAILDEEAAR